MTAFPKPTIVISKCIGFDPCRYNGEIVQDKFVTRLEPHVEFVCVCPEVEIGLGTPRAPVRIISSGYSFKLIQPSSGLDRFETEYLYGQTFFSPFPEELMALDDSGGGRA